MSAFSPKLPWAELFVRSGLKTLSDRVRQRPTVRRVRGAVDDLRSTVLSAARQRLPETTAVAERIIRRVLDDSVPGPSAIINATGVIAPRGFALPLAEPAIAAMNAVAEGFSTTSVGVETLLADLTGAQAALVLHSPAAAVLAALGVLGKPVVVARDHVGQIDGVSLAELATVVGMPLMEIGAIGRVSSDHYRTTLDRNGNGCLWYATGQSIRVEGDTFAPPAEEVFAVAHDRRCSAVEYLESATLVDLTSNNNPLAIPIVGASLLAGADLVIFPGDRFIGGPSCGIVVGRTDLLARVAASPLARAATVDPARLAALAATLQLTSDRERAMLIPVRQLLTASSENLRHRAEQLAAQLTGRASIAAAETITCAGHLNEGRLPSYQIAGWGVAITAVGPPEATVEKLLRNRPAVAVSLENGRILVNLRSVLARQDEQIAAAFQAQN